MGLDAKFVGLGMVISSIPSIMMNLPSWKLTTGLGIILIFSGIAYDSLHRTKKEGES